MEHNYYRNIAGWFDFPGFYDFIIKKFSSGIFVEIGVWQGQSLMYLAEKVSLTGKNITIYGIDTFEGTGSAMLHEAGFNTPDELYNKYLQNIEPLKHLITTIRGNSHDICSQFADESIDFLFIDGDHSYDAVKNDIALWYPKIKPGGMISGHDYTKLYNYGVVKAVNEFFGRKNIKRIGKFVWYYIKSIRMTIHAKGYWLEISGPNTHTFDKSLCDAISKMFKPIVKTAVDIGCGDGRYTRNLIEHEIDATGYDGSPLTPQVSGGLCGVKDFADPQDIGKFDLVLSLEVGEHIPGEWEQNFINNLCNTAAKFICLSWAVEGQPGYGHFNCRNNDYVISQMQERGFIFDKEASFTLRNASDKIKFPWFENTIMVFCRHGQSLLPEKYSTMKLRDIFKGYESSLVSVVLTSCGRLDCLKRTIETFNKFNTFPIHEFIICEDSGNRAMHDELKKLYPDYTLVLHKKNVGLVANIDSGYSRVKTAYVFHCEDDWEFNRRGFIEKSLDILLAYPKIMQVWIRALNDTNGHPVEDKFYRIDDTDFLLVSFNGVGGAWHGFTWNPGLRRISDWEKVGPFDKICPNLKAGEREMYVGLEFFRLGYRAAILPEGYCFHIGYQPKNYTLL